MYSAHIPAQCACVVSVVLVTLTLCPVSYVLSCSDIGDTELLSIPEKVQANYNELVVYGITAAKTSIPKPGEQYAVDFEVLCIFKGERVQPKIRIEEVGKFITSIKKKLCPKLIRIGDWCLI